MTVRVWDVRSGSCALTLNGHTSAVFALAVLPDGRLASGSGDMTVRVWDVRSGSCALMLSGHTGTVLSLAVLPDGCLAIVRDALVLRW
jgi:WD40 repeat protein